MSYVEENWQTTRPTIRERTKVVFNNDHFSDVKFVVRKMDGESESKQVIPAHKFVLSVSSPVFEAMFYGELAETRDSIELPDCEYESLLELFRYMYSDEVNLSGSNVMGVLYLAKKYMVPSLAEKCSEYLQDKLNASNIFSVLPAAQQYEEEKLVDRCWNVVDQQAEEAMKSDGFATIERSLLEAVVKRDTLSIEEVELFKAVDLWATKKCEEQGLSANGSEKRRILGEQIVKAIRFPVMKLQEFAGVVLDSKILTQEEVYNVVKYFSSVLSAPVGFPVEKRLTASLECCRFGSVEYAGSGHSYSTGKQDCLIFSVNKDISLLGVRLCGSENNEYSVTISIKQLDTSTNGYLNIVSGNLNSVLIKSERLSYYGFNIYFGNPVVIKKHLRYRIEASISGANSCSGQNGQNSMVCYGIKFKFQGSSASDNGTNVERGQFPAFLFTVI